MKQVQCNQWRSNATTPAQQRPSSEPVIMKYGKLPNKTNALRRHTPVEHTMPDVVKLQTRQTTGMGQAESKNLNRSTYHRQHKATEAGDNSAA